MAARPGAPRATAGGSLCPLRLRARTPQDRPARSAVKSPPDCQGPAGALPGHPRRGSRVFSRTWRCRSRCVLAAARGPGCPASRADNPRRSRRPKSSPSPQSPKLGLGSSEPGKAAGAPRSFGKLVVEQQSPSPTGSEPPCSSGSHCAPRSSEARRPRGPHPATYLLGQPAPGSVS